MSTGTSPPNPNDTRPLSVSNVDNRLLASAARLAWEPILERWISKTQKGFLKGRVMLHNVIDVDWAATTVSLKSETGALLLFDFKLQVQSGFPVSLTFVLVEMFGVSRPARDSHELYPCHVSR